MIGMEKERVVSIGALYLEFALSIGELEIENGPGPRSGVTVRRGGEVHVSLFQNHLVGSCREEAGEADLSCLSLCSPGPSQ